MVSILFCSTLATLAAAKQWADFAAYLAAGATMLVGLEKSVQFRESSILVSPPAFQFWLLKLKLNERSIVL